MHDHEAISRRRNASFALLQACEALDFQGAVDALDDGGNPLCCDDHGNPAWQILLTQKLPKGFEESERAAIFSVLFEAGLEPSFNIFSAMAEDIEDLELKECGLVLFHAVENFKDSQLSQRCMEFLDSQGLWFSQVLSEQQAQDLAVATPPSPCRSTHRL